MAKQKSHDLIIAQALIVLLVFGVAAVFSAHLNTAQNGFLYTALGVRYEAVNQILFGKLHTALALSIVVYAVSFIAISLRGLSKLKSIFEFELNGRYQRFASEFIWILVLGLLPALGFGLTFLIFKTLILPEYAFVLGLFCLWFSASMFVALFMFDDQSIIKVIRGAELRCFAEVEGEAREKTKNDSLRIAWGGLELPWSEAPHNFLAVGSIGSGKTTHFQFLKISTLQHFGKGLGQQAFIYSYKRDELSFLSWLNPKCPVYILDPYDERFIAWDVAGDIGKGKDRAEVRSLAEALVPKSQHTTEEYFRDAGVDILSGVIRGLQIKFEDQFTLRQLVLIMRDKTSIINFLSSIPSLKHLVEQHAKDIDKTFQCVLSTVSIQLGKLEDIAKRTETAKEKIRIREKIKNGEEFIIVLHGDPIRKTEVSAYNRLILTFAGMAVLSLPEARASDLTKYRRIWFYLDELPTLGRIELLPTLASVMRSKGGCLVAGLQDVAQLRKTYGVDDMNILLNNFGNRAFLRNEEFEAQEWCSKQLGTNDRIERSYSENNTTLRTKSYGSNQSIQNRPLVLPSEIGALQRASREEGIWSFQKNLYGCYEHFFPPKAMSILPKEDKHDLNYRPVDLEHITDWDVELFDKAENELIYKPVVIEKGVLQEKTIGEEHITLVRSQYEQKSQLINQFER